MLKRTKMLWTGISATFLFLPKSTDKTVKSTVSINKHGLFRESSFSPMDERGIVRKSA